jgi:triosephosphate isomerase (TIM)
MNKKYIIGNWKMNPRTSQEAIELIKNITVESDNTVEIIVMPPFTWLSGVKKLLEEGSDVVLGAQNMFWQEEGAYTGEISPIMLKDLNVKYVMIGHSERELYLNEDRKMVKNKLNLAIKSDLTPIVSFRPDSFENLEKDLLDLTENIKDKSKIFYLYEPTEAISTQGSNIPPKENIKTFANITKTTLGNNVVVIYGGSINNKNVKELIIETGIDGGLVGAKSLDANEFTDIIKNLKE